MSDRTDLCGRACGVWPATRAYLSGRQLIRLFKRHTGRTPQRYYLDLRLTHADRLLKQTNLPLSEVALACGFPSNSALSHSYKRYRGVSPTDARREGDKPIDVRPET